MSNFKLVSLNCRGLQDPKREIGINASVNCLQGTYCTEEDENAVYSQWGFVCFFFFFYKTDSRGTLTLFNNNFEYKLSKVKVNRSGNFIIY